MATDISNLKPKVDGVDSDSGRLKASEWNTLVTAVEENQREVRGAIKGINYNGTNYSKVVDGILEMTVMDTSGRKFNWSWVQKPKAIIAKGGKCIVEFSVSDQVASDEDQSVLVPYHNPGKVTFYVDDKQVGTVNDVYSIGNENYKGPIRFDFSEKTTLSTKAEGNSLKVVYTNSGLTKEEYFSVKVLDLSISAIVKNVYTTDEPTDISVTVRGAKCKIFASVDDEYLAGTDSEDKPIALGETASGVAFRIKDQLAKFNTHGIHNIKIWAEPLINNVTDVVTDTLSYNYIFGDATSSVPIVMTTIADGSEYELYSRMQVDYIAYLSGSNTTNRINIALTDGTTTNTTIDPENPNSSKGILLNTSQDIEFINGSGSGSYTFTLFPKGEDVLIGNNRKLVIGIIDATNNVEHKHVTSIVIKESSVNLEQAPGYLAYFSSIGRSNSESAETLRKWESTATDNSGIKTTVTFDDNIEFIDSGSGWCEDPNGNVAMHLRKGKYFTLNHKPFATNPTYGNNTLNANGLTISIEFATRNCLNDKAKVIECMDYTYEETGRGFYITASEAKLLANDISLGVKFKEDTRIKIDFVIEGNPTTYTYDTVVGTDPTAADYVQRGSSDECLAVIFVDGVYAGLTLVKESTTFLQGNTKVPAKEIRFGSEDCDLDIYNIRIYDRALTVYEIVQNYSYDTPNQAEKIEIAQRNDIFSSANNNMPVIDPGKLRSARPELPFFYVTLDPTHTDIMPQNKSDWKRLTMTTFENPLADGSDNHPVGADVAKSSFEAITGVLRNQGTSSMTYPWPWRNWDWKTGDSDFGDKKTFLYYFPKYNDPVETGSKWHQFEYSGDGSKLPIKKITLKKDYASSEMCNNAICSEIFTDMAFGIATAYPKAVSPAMRADIESTKSTNLKLSLKAMPAFMFQYLPNPDAEGSAGTGLDGMGMMNIIPNKNEVGYLGFKQNKWEDAEDGVQDREQSWELGDNLDDVFWVKELEGFKRDLLDESFTNDVKDIYEARTPKDSSVKWGDNLEADFGMTPKGLKTIDATKAAAVYDESKDIVDFHNWLVSCNRYLAKGGPIANSPAWNSDGKGGYLYTEDTPEYRLAKFKNEAPDRLLLDQWILYYIWREQFWMFDSGFKNLQVYTVGTNQDNPNSNILQWGCMVRDADTALGIENTGRDYFPPHIEDIDFYTESDGKITFHYGKADKCYHINDLKQFVPIGEDGQPIKGFEPKAVLNGQFGSVWVNLRDAFSAEIGQMYRTLINNFQQTNFGADPAIKKFRGHQEKWCESLYNFGMRQYFGGKPFSYFNTSGLGDKKNSRASWLERGFYYRRGKYRNLSDNSAFRINTYASSDKNFEKVLNVKSYIPMYIGCGGTTAEMVNSKNVIRLIPDTYEDGSIGKPISVGEDGFNFPSGGDAVSYIYGTSMITDIGDLARVCKLLRVQTMSFPKLREFNLGHESARDGKVYKELATKYVQNEKGEWVSDGSEGEEREFRNEILPSLDCSSMKQLVLLDVTNHTNLSELTIDTCDQLQYLYARGTILKSIKLPKTTSLKKIYLGSQLTSLELVDLTGIEEFIIEGLSNCSNLTIRNCGAYMAGESYNIVLKAIDKLVASATDVENPNVCSLRGIKWNNVQDNSIIEKLLQINADLTGEIELKSLSNDLKVRLTNKYGNIDTGERGLKIIYPHRSITSAKLPSKIYIHEPGEHQLAFTVNPTSANTYKSAKWELGAAAAKWATINETTGVITRTTEPGDADNEIGVELKVTIYQISDEDGNTPDPIIVTSKVFFYERVAKPGDIVFNDGSYSDELDDQKTPIGVCFYVDPRNKNRRLMVALKSLKIGNEWTATWGMYPGGDRHGNDGVINGYYGTDPTVSVEGDPVLNNPALNPSNTYCFDIPTMENIPQIETDMDPGQSNLIYITDNLYRDNNNVANNKFKEFDKFSYFGDLGWKSATSNIRIDKLNLSDGKTILTINQGDLVPSGYYNTLAIIEHRNKVLDEYRDGDKFIRPADKYDIEGYLEKSEFNMLGELINKAKFWDYASRESIKAADGITNGDALYYAAASACFAYEPTGVSNLADKFKKYNWFLPASGDVVRILYYCQYDTINSNSTYDDAKAFKTAVESGKLELANLYDSTGNNIQSSTESSMTSYYAVNNLTGKFVETAKSNYGRVRPICRF